MPIEIELSLPEARKTLNLIQLHGYEDHNLLDVASNLERLLEGKENKAPWRRVQKTETHFSGITEILECGHRNTLYGNYPKTANKRRCKLCHGG